MKPALVAYRQCLNSWHKMLLHGLLMLAMLNSPALLLAQKDDLRFERFWMKQGLSQIVVYFTL